MNISREKNIGGFACKIGTDQRSDKQARDVYRASMVYDNPQPNVEFSDDSHIHLNGFMCGFIILDFSHQI